MATHLDRPPAPVAPDSSTPDFRIAVIGSGFGGLGAAIRLEQEGIEDFVVLERAGDVAGTWRDNTYPGCQCDVPSHLYSFSFAPNPDWSDTYSRQPEIYAYLARCAREFGVLDHIRFNHEVLAARWDGAAARWRIETTGGALTAQVLVGATGSLSEPSMPRIPGIESFAGTMFHSARWDHDHDLSGRRVAVIGTGASAIQFVPRIQREVARLTLYQRTPPWVLPHSGRAVTRPERLLYRALPPAQRAVRTLVYATRELMVLGLRYDHRLLRGLELVARAHLRRGVPDPELRARLTPRYDIGCKRILISNDYYPALSQPNVEVVGDSIREVRAHSIIAGDGTERGVDTLIFGTGFHVTDSPAAMRIHGADGRTLAEVWDASPQAHLGINIAGFPNLFMLVGPNTVLAHSSMVFMIEAQIAYLLDCLRVMEERSLATVDVRPEVQEGFNASIQGELAQTVWNTGGCASWYLDATGRNTVLWPGFTARYRSRTRRFDPAEHVFESR